MNDKPISHQLRAKHWRQYHNFFARFEDERWSYEPLAELDRFMSEALFNGMRSPVCQDLWSRFPEDF